MIEICNLRCERVEFIYDIRVDRFNRILGNRFYMKSEADRDKVCDLYKVWFDEQIANRNAVVLNELQRIYRIYKQYGKLRLFCWCAPKRCHAETIKAWLEEQSDKPPLNGEDHIQSSP